VTELWLPAAHRSQATSPGPAVLAPYSTPGSASGAVGSRGRSGLVNGNDAASAAVSMVRRSASASVPVGKVVVQPCRERKVAGTVTSSSEAASARTAAISACRSSSLAAWTVRYRPRRNRWPSPRASR
jgi:hypothetical protein